MAVNGIKAPFWDTGGQLRNVKADGAKMDNATDDAPAFQAALDATTGEENFVPAGVSKLVVGATSPFDFGSPSAALPIHRAVAITRSDYYLRGPGALRVVGFEGADGAGTILMPAFSTDKNDNVGDLTNITFQDFALEADRTGSEGINRRGFYMVGVKGLRFIDMRVFTSTIRDLYFAHIHNCEDVQIRGCRFWDITAGFNFRYVKGIQISDFIMENFSEGIDFDGVSWDVVARNLIFRDGAPNQCIDINSVVDGVIDGVIAENVGNIVTINYKNTTPENYQKYVAGDPVVTMTPTERVTVRGVRGENTGSVSQPALFIGNDWSGLPHPGAPPVTDIKIIDWQIKTGGYIAILEGVGVLLENIRLQDITSPVGWAAIDARSQASDADELAWSDLDLTIRDVEVDGCDRGGVSVRTPSRLVIDGLRVRNADSLATGAPDLRVNRLDVRNARAYIDGLDIEGNVILNSDSTGDYELIWGQNNRIGGTLIFQGDVHEYIQGRTVNVIVGDIAATGTVSRVLYQASRKCRIARASLTTSANLTADASNYRAFSFKRVRAGTPATIAAPATNVTGFTAYEPRSAGFTVDETSADLEPGDVLILDSTHAGTGVAVTGLSVAVEVVEY